jgi:hypothetical protein
MKNFWKFSLIMCLIVLFPGISAFAEDTVSYGCYKKINGQLRVVSNPNECLPSELPISLEGGTKFLSLELYVDSSFGQDLKGYGFTAETPFKTIQYAVNQVPILRLTPEFAVTIFIAPGNYKETVVIGINQIKLIKNGVGEVLIEGANNSENTITIDGARGVVFNGLTIQGGYRGIHGHGGAGLEIIDGLIQNCAYRGIQVEENTITTLKGCTVKNCGSDGIMAFQNSGLIIAGECNITDNSNTGIWALLSSSIVANNGTLNLSGNGGAGIAAGQSSTLQLFNATINTTGNGQEGIKITGVSRFVIGGNNNLSLVTCDDNGMDGLGIFGSSDLVITSGTLTTQNNAHNGVSVVGSSHLTISKGTVLKTQNNLNYGLLISQSASGQVLGEFSGTNNDNGGIVVVLSSSVWMDGLVSILGNKIQGLTIGRSSSVQTSEFNFLHVADTTGGEGGDGSGISIAENSNLRSPGKVLVENNRDGMNPNGIGVFRNSNVTFKGPNVDVIIQNNGSTGIEIGQESSGRFEPGVIVRGNKIHGIAVTMNSQIFGQEILIQNNERWGIHAEDGSSVTCDNCTLSDTNGAGGIELNFGSRSTLNGGLIASIFCDPTVLTRGTFTCP